MADGVGLATYVVEGRGFSQPGACERRSPIWTVAEDMTEESLLCPRPPPHLRCGGSSSSISYTDSVFTLEISICG